MNARNPTGRKGYRSPGRRALSDNGVPMYVPEECRRDMIWKILWSALVRNVGKLQTLPQGTPQYRRTELQKRTALALEMVQHRTTAIMNLAALRQAEATPEETFERVPFGDDFTPNTQLEAT